MAIQQELRRIVEGRETLSLPDAAALMRRVLAGDAADVELAALLGAMAARGETAAEIAGFATAMREAAIPLPLTALERDALVDTCGTGGDGSGTFNISTAAALVAAAAGAKVAKHGNRAITSRAGSADVLEVLGIPIHLAPPAAAEAIRRHGFAFLLAPAHHPALAAGMPVRRALGVRTMLHVLGPLLNPAGARRQVMGVYAARLVPVVAEAMTLLSTTHAMVVHGDSQPNLGAPASSGRTSAGPVSAGIVSAGIVSAGIDELALSGPSHLAEVRGPHFEARRFHPADVHLAEAPLSALAGGDAAANAAILRSIFAGEPGPRRDVVVLNAAAVLVTAGLSPDLAAGVTLAQQSVDSGAVTSLVRTLASRA